MSDAGGERAPSVLVETDRNNQPTSILTAKDSTSSTNKKDEMSSDSNNVTSNPDEVWNNEPANPLNWPKGKKWRSVLIVSGYTFVAYAFLISFRSYRLLMYCSVPWHRA